MLPTCDKVELENCMSCKWTFEKNCGKDTEKIESQKTLSRNDFGYGIVNSPLEATPGCCCNTCIALEAIHVCVCSVG